MTTEELKLILETLKTISGDASTATIVWISLRYGVEILTTALVCGTFFGVVYKITSMITSSSEWARLGKSVSVSYGGEGKDYIVYPADKRAIQKAIKAAEGLK